MSPLHRLMSAAQAVSPEAELHIVGIQDQPDWYVLTITVGDVVLVQSQAAPLDEAIVEVVKRLEHMSQRIHVAVSVPSPSIDIGGPDDLYPPDAVIKPSKPPGASSKPPKR
jgi:hypothetical protein